MVHQFDKLTANKQAQEKLLANPKVTVLYEHEPRGFSKDGDQIVTEIEDLKTKERKKLISDGVFVFIGFTLFRIDESRDRMHLLTIAVDIRP